MLTLEHFIRTIEGGEVAKRAFSAVEFCRKAELITVTHVDAHHERVDWQRHIVLAVAAVTCVIVVGEERVGTL